MKKGLLVFLLAIFALFAIFISPTWAATVVTSPPSVAAPVCTNSKPGTPTLSNALVTGTNQATLYWTDASNATSWTAAYGGTSGDYIWGFTDFGDANSRSATVSYLSPGTYYFVVRANNGCMPGAFSGERSVSVAGAAVVARAPALVPEAGAAPRTEEEVAPPAVPPAAVQPAPPPPGPITTVIRLGLPLALGVVILGTASFIIFRRWFRGE